MSGKGRGAPPVHRALHRASLFTSPGAPAGGETTLADFPYAEANMAWRAAAAGGAATVARTRILWGGGGGAAGRRGVESRDHTNKTTTD